MKRLRKSVLTRYLASYMSVVLLVCFSLGMLLLLSSTDRLMDAQMDIYRSRLNAAANDLEQQFKALEDILVDIKTKVVFQPFYLMRNAVYDMELIGFFSRYTSFSPLAEEYYLWYQVTDAVYGQNSRYQFSVFAKHLMGGAGEDSLRELLSALPPVTFASLPQRPDALLVAMPLHIGSRNDPKGTCTMLFVLHLNTLWQRMKSIADLTDKKGILITYKGTAVMGSIGKDAETLSALSQEGKISVSIPKPSTEVFSHLDSFRTYAIWCIVAMAALFMAVAAFAAYRNYIPIKRLHQKFGEQGRQQSANEIQQIEETLSHTLELNRLSRQQIDRQVAEYNRHREWLKQQFMMMLLAGEYSDEFDRRMLEMGFEMPHPLFSILFVHIRNGVIPERITGMMESFSDEDMILYAAELKPGERYAVLVNYKDKGVLPELAELLMDAFLAKDLAVSMQVSDVCDGLSSIAMAGLNALRGEPSYASVKEPAANMERREVKGEFLPLVAAIEAADEDRMLRLMDQTFNEIETEYPSYLMRAYILSNLQMRISTLAYRSGMSPFEDRRGKPFTSNDVEALKKELKQQALSICRFLHSDPDSDDPVVHQKMQDYIRAHALEGSINLTSVAEAFDISTKQVTRILKAAIRMTFKEYLIQLRMDAARKLLIRRDTTIAEVAEKVGYYNISHFIRCFKEYAGVTPGEYKKSFE